MFYKEKFPLPRCYGCALLCYTASNVCACANVVMTRWRVRGVLSGCGNQVATHELQTATQSSKYRCFKSVWLVWQSSKQNGKSTSYPFLKNLCVQKLASFPFPYICFSFYDFSERFTFLSSFLGDSSSFLCFPLKFFAGSWHAAGRNWSPRSCPTFDRCVWTYWLCSLCYLQSNILWYR